MSAPLLRFTSMSLPTVLMFRSASLPSIKVHQHEFLPHWDLPAWVFPCYWGPPTWVLPHYWGSLPWLFPHLFQYGTRHILNEMNSHGHNIQVLYLCGGLRKNTLFVQTHADALGEGADMCVFVWVGVCGRVFVCMYMALVWVSSKGLDPESTNLRMRRGDGCCLNQELSLKRPLGHPGGWATPYLAGNLLDRQNQRVDISAHATNCYDSLPRREAGDVWCLPPCLESQGCHLIPLCSLLSCSSA